MKIKINETESHIIEFPEELNLTEFNDLLKRLNTLSTIYKPVIDEKEILKNWKNHNKESKGFVEIKSRKKMDKNATYYLVFKDREIIRKLMIIHHHGTLEENRETRKLLNYPALNGRFNGLRLRHNILPEEVGLRKFPDKKECFDTNFLENNKIEGFITHNNPTILIEEIKEFLRQNGK